MPGRVAPEGLLGLNRDPLQDHQVGRGEQAGAGEAETQARDGPALPRVPPPSGPGHGAAPGGGSGSPAFKMPVALGGPWG